MPEPLNINPQQLPLEAAFEALQRARSGPSNLATLLSLPMMANQAQQQNQQRRSLLNLLQGGPPTAEPMGLEDAIGQSQIYKNVQEPRSKIFSEQLAAAVNLQKANAGSKPSEQVNKFLQFDLFPPGEEVGKSEALEGMRIAASLRPPDSALQRLQGIRSGASFIDSLADRWFAAERAGKTGPLMGSWSKFFSYITNGYLYPDIKNYTDFKNGMATYLKNSVGQSGALTDEERKVMTDLLADAADGKVAAAGAFVNMYESFSKKEKDLYDIYDIGNSLSYRTPRRTYFLRPEYSQQAGVLGDKEAEDYARKVLEKKRGGK